MALVESSRLWTTGGAGDGASTYTRDNMAEFFRNMLLADFTTQGVLNGLAVSGSSSPLTLATGAACVYGFLHFCTTSGSLGAITTPSVGTTGFHVVLRADWTAQTVRAVCVRNTDGVSATPAVTQSAGTTWEIRLATGTITTGGVITLTDARAFVANPSKVFTSTRVPFATTGGQLTDSSKLAWDDTNNRLTINSGYALPIRGRQGGSATNWNTQGTTNQTLVTTRVQTGVIRCTVAGGAVLGTQAVTFPVAYSQAPMVLVSFQDWPGGGTNFPYTVRAGTSTTTGFGISVDRQGSTGSENFDINWLAIGQE